MNNKVTAVAAANIAFIKYWGTRDLTHTLPFNPSYSMTLSRCSSRTTVECLGEGVADEVFLWREGKPPVPAPDAFAKGVRAHLGKIREWSGSRQAFRVATVNSFPTGAGIASSASGFCALAVGAVAALGLSASPRELSVLARLSGSGSAARSAMGGYVEWPAGDDESEGYAMQKESAEHWDLCDLVVILDQNTKKVSSLEGHRLAPSSPYFEARQEILPARLERTRNAVRDREFGALAKVVEEEAVDLHMIAMTSVPPIFYWSPGTLEVMHLVRDLRSDGVEACFTMDAGANVHVICTPQAQVQVGAALERVEAVQTVLEDRVGRGPKLIDDHLF